MKRRDLKVDAGSFTRDELVRVGTCPQHGRMATGTVTLTFRSDGPVWTHLVGLVFHPLGAALAARFAKKVTGRLPVCDRCSGRKTARVRNTVLLSVLGFGIFCLGVATDNLGMFALGCLLGGLAVFRGVVATTQRGSLNDEGSVVTLKQVSPGFRDVLEGRAPAPLVPDWSVPSR